MIASDSHCSNHRICVSFMGLQPLLQLQHHSSGQVVKDQDIETPQQFLSFYQSLVSNGCLRRCGLQRMRNVSRIVRQRER